jgi:A/G-specific adenine glycosylase
LEQNFEFFFGKSLLEWYPKVKRDLPWRATKDPYAIWLSEVILQQTRVAQGMPYYLRFIEAYPTLKDMATAPQEHILKHWQGLGYYSRARNMHQTAQYIYQELGGIFPDTYAGLLKLKGVGPYTAAAVASFAYNEDVAVVDGNVYRVLARIMAQDQDIAKGPGQKHFAQLAQTLLPKGQAQLYNQAIMEFGSLQCTPNQPNCAECIFKEVCLANLMGQQKDFPVKSKLGKRRTRHFTYIMLNYEGSYYFKKRTEKDIWQDLYEPLLIETDKPMPLEDLLYIEPLNGMVANATIGQLTESLVHKLSHQDLHIRFLEITLSRVNGRLLEYFLKPEKILQLGKPIAIAKHLERIWHK